MPTCAQTLWEFLTPANQDHQEASWLFFRFGATILLMTAAEPAVAVVAAAVAVVVAVVGRGEG